MATPHIFYPYPVVRTGWLSLRAELKAESEGVSQLTHGSIDAVGAPEPFEIDLTLEFDPGIARRDLNLEEEQSNHVQLVLVESGIHSRLRVKVAEFPLNGGTRAVKTVRYDPADCRGDIALQAFLVYTVQASRVASGTRCSESERVLVHFDEFGSPPGQGIEIKWVDFSKEDRYTDVKDELFVLDLITEPPVLLLNEGLPGFKSVLMSRGRRGSAARIREAEFTLIESQVWNVMLAEALGRLVDAGDDEEEINEQLGGWRGRVLRGWAPALMGYREAGVKDLASRMRAHPDELLLNILPRKVQLRAGAGRSFSGLNGEFIDQRTTRESDDE